MLKGIPRTVLVLMAGVCGGVGAVAQPADALQPGQLDSSASYLIGPGDSLQIFVWDHPDLSSTVQVRLDGKLSTPLVEDLQAAGRTPTELARAIEAVLSAYIRSPVVTVIMQSFLGDTQQIRVVGQAVSPRAIPYRQGMTVLDVVIAAGGLSEFAAGNRAKIVRNVEGKRTEFRVKLDDLVNKGRTDRDVPMQPGDVLVIPESIL